MNSAEIAREIISQTENAGISLSDVESYATPAEVEKWLIATDNNGGAQEISRIIFEMIE